MDHLLALGKLTMLTGMEHMNVITGNLTNVMTPGFKQRMHLAPAADSFLSQLQKSGASIDTLNASMVGGFSQAPADMRTGALKETGNPLDIALDRGVFIEASADGQRVYLKGASLKITADGDLVGAGNVSLANIGLPVDLEALEISADGRISHNDAAVGQLRLVRLSDQSELIAAAPGVYRMEGQSELIEQASSGLKQGYLEQSNVNQVQGMISMIQNTRHFELGQRMISAYSDLASLSMDELGNF